MDRLARMTGAKMRGASVEFVNVAKRYNSVEALADFDLVVEPGEFMTLLGPSGSGKTTALNVLAGFSDATSGRVMIDGRSVGDLPPEKRNLGMVFQSYSLFPHMNVFENVAFPLRLRRFKQAEISRRVRESLEMVQLSEFAERKPKELSGGQRQRVAFARAVVFEPPVLLMDEPLGALDLKLRQTMQLEIKRYHEQIGCTIVFVTHDQGEALTLSDRIAVMSEGRIAQVDTPDRIYDSPRTRYVAEFIGKTNLFSLVSQVHGKARIDELGCEISVDALPHSASGKTSLVSVRPEKITRITTPTEGTVSFQAQIEEVHFLGDLIQYRAHLDNGTRVSFQEQRGPRAERLRRNETVCLGFEVMDALPLSDR
jgi:putative spermidine/putrescine transport system ATP-binding protein